MKKLNLLWFGCIGLLLINSCGQAEDSSTAPKPKVKSMLAEEVDPMDNKGIGPISSIDISGPIDTAMAAAGEEVYILMCTACHKAEEKFIGPSPKGIFERRSPEWVMNMILNPEEMVAKDPIAKKLLLEYNMSPMANQHLSEEQARQVVEYFRTL